MRKSRRGATRSCACFAFHLPPAELHSRHPPRAWRYSPSRPAWQRPCTARSSAARCTHASRAQCICAHRCDPRVSYGSAQLVTRPVGGASFVVRLVRASFVDNCCNFHSPFFPLPPQASHPQSTFGCEHVSISGPRPSAPFQRSGCYDSSAPPPPSTPSTPSTECSSRGDLDRLWLRERETVENAAMYRFCRGDKQGYNVGREYHLFFKDPFSSLPCYEHIPPLSRSFFLLPPFPRRHQIAQSS